MISPRRSVQAQLPLPLPQQDSSTETLTAATREICWERADHLAHLEIPVA